MVFGWARKRGGDWLWGGGRGGEVEESIGSEESSVIVWRGEGAMVGCGSEGGAGGWGGGCAW